MSGLNGKVAVVTRASRGVGKGIALELAATGATVYATGRTVAAQTFTVDGLIPLQCDHTVEKEVATVSSLDGSQPRPLTLEDA